MTARMGRWTLGDRVEMGEGDEHDTGTIVAFRLNGGVAVAVVAWDGAGEEYSEDPTELTPLKEKS